MPSPRIPCPTCTGTMTRGSRTCFSCFAKTQAGAGNHHYIDGRRSEPDYWAQWQRSHRAEYRQARTARKIASRKVAYTACKWLGCGETKTQHHHWDHAKPLAVTDYCRKHHAAADFILKWWRAGMEFEMIKETDEQGRVISEEFTGKDRPLMMYGETPVVVNHFIRLADGHIEAEVTAAYAVFEVKTRSGWQHTTHGWVKGADLTQAQESPEFQEALENWRDTIKASDDAEDVGVPSNMMAAFDQEREAAQLFALQFNRVSHAPIVGD